MSRNSLRRGLAAIAVATVAFGLLGPVSPAMAEELPDQLAEVEAVEVEGPAEEASEAEASEAESALGSEGDAAAPPTAQISQVVPFPAGVTRLEGADRFQTAVAVSARYGAGVPALIIATGANFPDALSGAAAAASIGAPLLLTQRDRLLPEVAAEIARLAPERVYVLGSESAVGDAVLAAVSEVVPGTTRIARIAGPDRFATSIQTVREFFPSAGEAFIATGRNFPDALAASGAAGALGAPVVLVDGAQPGLGSEALALLGDLGVTTVRIAGGTPAVSDAIEQQLRDRGLEAVRYGGADRYETAAHINDAFFTPGSASAAFLATGLNFPDALAGAALAGYSGAPVYITQPACRPDSVRASMARLAAPGTVVLGSAVAVGSGAASGLGCLRAGAVSISGTTQVGETLRANVSGWPSGAQLSYQWYAGSAAIPGATGVTLTLTAAQQGAWIAVEVVGTQSGYASATARSIGVGPVRGTPPPPPPVVQPPAPVYPGSVTAGAFCAKELAGYIGYTSTGVRMVCKTSSTDSRLRWRQG